MFFLKLLKTICVVFVLVKLPNTLFVKDKKRGKRPHMQSGRSKAIWQSNASMYNKGIVTPKTDLFDGCRYIKPTKKQSFDSPGKYFKM